MAHLIQGNNIGEVWSILVSDLMFFGKRSSPRGFGTRETLNVTLEVTDGLRNILISEKRNLNYRFMVAEWLWIQAGLNDVQSLAAYNSIIKKFSDDDQILSGAYGPRIQPQMEYIIKALDKLDSRQAVATIWTPSPADSKDIPCTISLQWLLRDEKLHCTVNMRSSDVWLGLPYDFFTFSQLTNLIAGIIGVPVGSVTMNLASSHLYDSNYEEAKAASAEPFDYLCSPQLPHPPEQPLSRTTWLILNRSDLLTLETGLPEPWLSYSKSLRKDKAHCLEVLREIAKAV